MWTVRDIVSRYRLRHREGRREGMSTGYRPKYFGHDATFGYKVRHKYKMRLVFTLPSHLPSLPTISSTTTNRAPLPFQCAPKSQLPVTGYWDEKKLEENHDTAFANQMGRIDVEGKDYICPPLCQVRFHESCVIQKM